MCEVKLKREFGGFDATAPMGTQFPSRVDRTPSELPQSEMQPADYGQSWAAPGPPGRALAAECPCRGHSRRRRRGARRGDAGSWVVIHSLKTGREGGPRPAQAEMGLGAIRAAANLEGRCPAVQRNRCAQHRRSVNNAKSPCESKTLTRSPVLRNVGPRVASAGRWYPAFRPAAASSSSPHEPRLISTSSHSLRGISPEVTPRIEHYAPTLTRSD
jgi:hypothetical protein